MSPGHPSIGRWIASVAVGEVAGFAVAAGVAVAVTGAGIPDPAAYPLIVLAGAGEGALLGTGQVIGLGRFAPPPARWIAATSVGAAAAWALGMLPSILGLRLTLGTAIGIAVGAVVLLAAIPTVQWLVIRRRSHSRRWIPASMGAWAVAVLWTAAPSPIIDERSPAALVVLLYVAAGALMAVTIAALTAPLARSVFAGPAV